jgi:hypothetical protein
MASGAFPRFLDISGRRAYQVSRGAPPRASLRKYSTLAVPPNRSRRAPSASSDTSRRLASDGGGSRGDLALFPNAFND